MRIDPHISDLLPEYVLGSLEENEARQVAEHLAECHSCRAELVAYQQVADQLVAAGIHGIVNFAPVALSLPVGIGLVGVDLTTELEQLAFSVANRLGSR